MDDFIDLLEDAARTCQQRGRRLLVLVDGLDEDQTIEPGLAVANWLPDAKTLPDNTWLLVASRVAVPVPLPDGHPLSAHIHPLTVSVAASELQKLAKAELDEALKAGGLVYDLLGLLAAAFGGLTITDLTELIQRHRHTNVSSVEVGKELDRSLARSVSAEIGPEDLEEPVRVFAHDALQDHARMLYARDLSRYYALFDQWGEDYKRQDWPAATPPYLLRPYTRQLASQALDPASTPQRRRQVIDTLYQITTHPARGTLLLQRTGNLALYNQEITTTQRLLVDTHERRGIGDETELIYRLAVLALDRRPLRGTLAEVAVSVSSVWAQAGRFSSALAVATDIEDAQERAAALTAVAGGLARAGQADQAMSVATGIEDAQERAGALTAVAGGLARAGQADQAMSVATGIQDLLRRARVLADVADALVRAGLTRQAGQAAGLAAEAARIASSIKDPLGRARLLADMAARLARAGLAGQAAGLAAEAAHIASSITDPRQRARVLVNVADSLARAGQGGQAISVAAGIEDPGRRARVLADVAATLARVEQGGQAISVAAEAAHIAAGIKGRGQRAWVLAYVAVRLTEAGQADLAASVASCPGSSADVVSGTGSYVGSRASKGHSRAPPPFEGLSRSLSR